MANLLAKFFANKQSQPQPQPAPQNQGTPMQQAAQTGLATPPNPQSAPTGQSVLDQYAFFMQNKGQGQETAQTPKFNIPPEELAKIAQGQDFTKSIPPELMARLQQGDLTALPAVLNSVGQASYQAAMGHSMGLTDQFVSHRFDHEQSNLRGVVDQQMTSRNLDQSLAHLHPYAQKMFKDIAADFRKQFPDASDQDIQDTTWATFKEIGGQSNNDPASVQARQRTEQAQPNWDKFGDFDEDSDQSGAANQGASQTGGAPFA